MATNVEFENGAVEGNSIVPNESQPLTANEQLVAQAQGVPTAQADPVPVDAGSGQPVQAPQPTAAAPVTPAGPAEYTADASNVVRLPANVAIDNIKVDGNNLVLAQADGSEIVIKDAAADVPTFIIGDVEVPRVALIAALEAGGVDVAFGADGSISAAPGGAQSSGGNFENPVGDIGNGFDLSALLPPTALAFPQYELRELTNGRNADPLFANFSIRLSEEGLEGGLKDSDGSPDDLSNDIIYTGTFGATDPNGDPLTYSLGLPTTPGLSSHGQPIVWEQVGPNLLIGKIGGGGDMPSQEIIRVEITDPSTGAFKIEIKGPIDHPEKGAEDVLGIDVPVTVQDPFGGSATGNVTIEIEDDSPELNSVRLVSSTTLDETNAGTPGGFPIEVTTGGNVLSFSSAFGGDGAAAGGGIAYVLSLSNGASTSLKTAVGDFPITLVQTNATTITGVYENGGTKTAFTVKINADGSLTVTQNVPLEHNTDGGPGSAHNDVLTLSNLVSATVTLTDFDGDSTVGGAQIGGSIRFLDDGPSVSENNIVKLDDDALDGGNVDGTGDDVDSANVSGTLAHNFGADGGSIAWLTNGAPQGFTYKPGEGGSIEVFQGATKVLTITLNSATGAYTVTQNAPIMHAAGDNENNQNFTLTYQVTDNDGDTANGTLQINVDDDTPTISGGRSEPTLTVDETVLGTNATGSFAGSFVVSAGADGLQSITYGLSVVAGNAGLVDTATGQQVVLSMNGTTVEGKTTGGVLVFTVKVDANGDVTLDQIRAVKHADVNNHDESLSLAENLIKLTATVTDKDGDSSSATLNIGDNLVFKDDGPSVTSGNAAVTVDEDDILNLQSQGTSPDGDTELLTGAAKATGSLSSLVNFGADGAAAGGGFGFTANAVSEMQALGLTSKDAALSYVIVGNTLIGFVDNGNGQYNPLQDRSVMSMTVEGNGNFAFRLVDQLDHAAPPAGTADENTLQIDFGKVIKATDRDGDSVSLGGKVNVTVVDDIPQVFLKATGEAVTHDETAGIQPNDDTSSAGVIARFAGLNAPAAIGYAHQGGVVVYGTQLPFQGADEPISMSLSLAINGANGTDSGIKTTAGREISLFLENGILVGRVDNANGTPNANGQIAFAVAVDQNGGISIAQYVPLKHPTAGESPADHDEPINLGSSVKVVLTATDNDGDTVTKSVDIGGKIVFEDDGPKVGTGNAAITVDEDDIANALSQGTSPFDGSADGSNTDLIGGGASSSGSLAAVVNFGTDGPASSGAYAFTSSAVADMVAIGLQSKGVALSYTILNGNLIAYADNGNGSYNPLQDRTVFSLAVNGNNGNFTFRLYDQLDHVKPQSGADQNTDLATASGPKSSIDFGSIIKATDGDGDFVTLDGKVNVTVRDDIPQVFLKATGASVIHDESAGLQNDDINSGNIAARFSVLGAPAAIGFAHQNGVVVYGTELLQGADEPVVMSVALGINGGDGADSGLKTTAGLEISLFLENGLIVGRVDNVDGTPNSGGQIAFAVAIDQNGGVSVAQYQSLQHPIAGTSASAHDDPVNLGNLVKVVLTATDNDGDTVVKSVDVGTKIQFEDDGPRLESASANGTKVTLDEGNTNAGIDGTSSAATILLPGGYTAGDDAHVSGSGVISSATSAGALVNVVGSAGADGPNAGDGISYALTVTNPVSGVVLTDGTNVTLVQISPTLVLGVVGTTVAFAVSMNADTGAVTVEQYLSLKHGDTSNYDEPVSLTTGSLSVTATITDGDGDTKSSNPVNVGNQIVFEDDGPRITVTAPESVANGLFFSGFQDNNGAWGTGSGINTSGTAGAWSITASPVQGAGTVVLEKVGDGYRGSDSPTNSVMVDMEATPGNIQLSQTIGGLTAGESYGLSFEIGAASDAAAGSAKLEVVWNGQVVGTYTPTSGVMQTIMINVPALGGNNTLEFREIGAAGDNTGTFLGNVKLNDVIVIDETKGIDAASDEVAAGGVSALFTGVNGGTDADMPEVQYAQGTGSIVGAVAAFGADGPAAQNSLAYALELASANGVDSGLKTTEGQNIVLYKDNSGRIVGVYDANNNGISSNDKVAFALHVNVLTGVMTIAQYVSLYHPDTTSQDEGITLAANTVSVKVTATDGDGDTASGSADISGRVLFEDDGPTLDVGVNTQGAGVAGLTLQLDETVQPDGASNVNHDSYADGEGESGGGAQNGGADDVVAPVLNYNQVPVIETAPSANEAIGSRTTAAGAIGNLFTGWQTAVFGADGAGANGGISRALSLVLGGGAFVATNLSATQTGAAVLAGHDAGDLKIYLHQVSPGVIEGRIAGADGVAGTGDDFVAFRITLNNAGDPSQATITVDQFMAIQHGDVALHDENLLLQLTNGGSLDIKLDVTVTDGDGDKVTDSATVNLVGQGGSFISFDDDGPKVISVTNGVIIDDEDAPNAGAAVSVTGIQGGPGDNGAGNVAVGKINFDAGSDGLKSIVASGIDGLKAIHVGTNGIGTQYDVTQTWVANGAGGTLTGTIDTNGAADGGIVTVYTLSVDASGNYTFTLNQPLVHPATDNPDTPQVETEYEDNLSLNFGFTITDGDGDKATGAITVNVDDDTPDAVTSLPAPTVMDEPGSPEATTTNVSYVFGGANGSTPDLGAISVNFGTVVANVGAGATLQGPAQNPGAQPMIFTADAGTTFKISGGAIGLFGAIGGASTVTLKGYDAGGNLIGTYTFNAGAVGAATISPSTVFNAIGTPFAGLELSKLELVPPANFAGRIILDDLGIGHVTTVPSVTETAQIDLMQLVNFGEDGAHANGAFQLNTVAAQDFGTLNSNGQEVQVVSSGGKLLGYTTGGTPVFEVEIVNGKAVLTLLAPLDHNGASTLNLDFSKFITARDGDGDGIGLGEGSVVFSVKESNLKPSAGTASAAVDDDGLGGNAAAGTGDIVVPNTDNDNNEATFIGTLPGSGGNGALVYSFAGMDGQRATVGQETVEYTWNAGSNTLTAFIDGGARDGQALFSVTVNPATGIYDLKLLLPVAHTSGDNTEASVSVVPPLAYTVGDSDANTSPADTGTGTLKIEFNDDVPSATPVVHQQMLDDEGQAGGITVNGAAGDVDAPEAAKTANGSLGIIAGADGLQKIEVSLGAVAGEAGALPKLQAIYVDPGTKMATVYDVTTTWTQDGVGGKLVGTITVPGGIGTLDVFKLTVDASGQYQFEMLRPLAHPLTDNPATAGTTELEYEDDLSLTFNYKVTDRDGDTASSTLNVKVDDDTLDIGTLQALTAVNGVTTVTGAFAIEPGADGISGVDFTPPAGLKSGGLDLQYTEVGNQLVAHTGNPGSPVFTITVNPLAHTYSFQSFKPLDGVTSSVNIGQSTAFGAGPGNAYVLQSGTGESLAIVSGWTTAGVLAQVNGSTPGWGVNSATFDQGEMLRFDFQDADNFGAAGYTPPTFSGPAVSSATFDFKGLNNSSVGYVVHYTDGTTSASTLNVNGQSLVHTFSAPAGKFIDYVELMGTGVTGGGGKVSLTSVDRTNTTIDVNINVGVKVTDGDGDSQSTTINVHVVDSTPSITDLAASIDGGDLSVDEDDLAAGSDTIKEPLTQQGTFKIQAGDGIDDLKVGGHDVIVNGAFQGGSITTPLGSTLTFTNYNSSTGEVTYTYTLNGAQSHPGGSDENALFEDFSVVLTDTDGDTAASTLSVKIVDDVPDAIDDTNSIGEDASSVIGNVLTNDVSGADGGKLVTTTGAFPGQYGTLVLNNNGSYTYTLNTDAATQALIQALPAGGTLKDSFNYTMTDDDGDTDIAKLEITINGANDGVTIGGLDVTGGEETVYENDLPNGSSPDNAALTQPGSFTVTAADGIATIEIGGQSFTYAALAASDSNNLTINSPQGELVITGYSGGPAGGTVYYSYTLDTTVANGAGSDQASESFTVKVTDVGNDSQTGSLDITIVDDVPTANAGAAMTVLETAGSTTGENLLLNDVRGADGATVTHVNFGSGFVAINTGTPVPGGYSFIPAGGQGTYVFNANGSWSFDPAPNSATITQSGSFNYRITDADGDVSEALQTVNVTNANALPTAGTVTATVDDEGLANGNPGNGSSTGDVAGQATTANGTLTNSFNGDAPAAVDPINFTPMNGTTGMVGTESVTYSWNAATNTLTANSVARGAIFTVQVDGGADNGTGNYAFTLLKPVLHADGNGENDALVNLTYQVKDAQNDTATGTLSITIDDDTPIANNDTATLQIVVDDLGVGAINAKWTNVVMTSDSVTSYDRDNDGSTDEIRWGTGSNQSGYGFVDNPDLTGVPVMTNETFSLGTFTHFNFPVNGGTLDTVKLSVTFNAIINGVTVPVGPITINFDHTETSNTSDPEASRDIISISTQTATVNIAGQNYTLDVLGFVDTNGQTVTTVRTYESMSNSYQLEVRLVSSDTTSITTTGNVINNSDASDASGADLPLQVSAIAHSGAGTSDNTADVSGNFQVNGTYGTLVIHKNGTYTYTLTDDASEIPANVSAETFTYTVVDADGDPATATLTINLNKVDGAGNPLDALHDDRVVTNISGNNIVISEAALLVNDDAGSMISGLGSFTDAANVTRGGGNVTFQDNDTDGGKFIYTSGSANAEVTVVRQTGSALTGTSAAEILIGQDGVADTIDGKAGRDVILAGTGDDIIVADQTDKLIDGGGGADTLNVGSFFTSDSDAQLVRVEKVNLTAAATLNLSNQTEGFAISGSSGADSITGGSGSDTINAAQNDTLIDGGGGTDTLNVGANFTSTGNGQIVNVENVVLTSAATLNLANQTEGFTITGSSGSDTITGGSGADAISAGAGNDTINAAQNDTLIDGGADTDTLSVGANFTSANNAQIVGIENVTLTAAATLNLSNQLEGFNITGSTGADTITGGSGADIISGGLGNDTLNGGAGNDTFNYVIGDGADNVNGGADSDTLAITGTTGNDILDVIWNGSALTQFEVGTVTGVESVTANLGAGSADVLNYAGTTSGVSVNLAAGTASGFTSVSGIENVTGGSGADTLTGDVYANTLIGGSGMDTLTGGGGNDTLTGGADADTFNVDSGTDTITDLGAGADILKVSAGAIANATAAAAWTATNASSNAGTASVSGSGVTLNVSAATGTGGWTLTNTSTSTAAALTGSANADKIVSSGAGDTINAGAGADTVTINAGTSTRAWTVDLGNDSAVDAIVYKHADVDTAENTVATVNNFKVANDRIAVHLDGQNVADGGFVTVTSAQTNIAAGTEVIELLSGSWVSGSLTDDINSGTIEDFIQAATNGIPEGTYTFIVYSSTDVSTANAGIYTVTITDDTNPGGNFNSGSGSVVEHIMTLNGVGYGNLSASNFVSAVDPIMLDLDHNGMSFSNVEGGIRFDINADGVADQVAWNTSGDGILAYDVNGDGKIDSGAEIFTPDFAGGHFASGSEALASLDSNGDGIVDANDEAFSKLMIWQDANSDGVGEMGELTHLSDHGITGLSTSTTASSDFIDGQAVVGEGAVHYADGSTGTYVEVMLDGVLGTPEANQAQPTGETFVIDGLNVTDIIPDYDGGKGDQLDLSALLSGLAPDTDLAAQGYVSVVQNGADAEVKVDVDGGGDSFQTVAVLENYTAVNEAVKVLFEDNSGTKHSDNI